jgi:hypothetical protein
VSLVTDIRDAAVKSDVSIAELLRRCAVLAASLRNQELKEWALLELNGYPKNVPLPDYRVIPAHAVGHLAGPLGSGYKGITIPASVLPEKMRDYADVVRLRQPIAALDSLARMDDTKGELTCPWPGDLVALMQDKFGSGLILYAAWQALSKANIAGIIDSVRNRVLEFSMQLDEESSQSADNSSTVSNERVHHLVQTIIYGNVQGDVIAGVSGSVIQVAPHDLASLKASLLAMGVPEPDVATLTTAVKQDERAERAMGAQTSTWVGTLASKVSSGAVTLAKGISISLIVKAILVYFGHVAP